MIKLPNKLLAIIFLTSLASVLFSLVLLLSQNDSENYILNLLNKFFISFLLSSIFLTLFIKQSNGKIKFLTSPLLTLAMLILGTLVLSFFIIQVIKFEFLSQGKSLYWQISIPILAIFSLGIIIDTHIKLIKKKY